VYPNGHAVQLLGLDYHAGKNAGTLDGISPSSPISSRASWRTLCGHDARGTLAHHYDLPDVLIAIR